MKGNKTLHDHIVFGIIRLGKVPLLKKGSSGYPASSILDEIKREFDLVVMGTRGHGVFAGAVLGSVTQRVLARASCPVLVVNSRNFVSS